MAISGRVISFDQRVSKKWKKGLGYQRSKVKVDTKGKHKLLAGADRNCVVDRTVFDVFDEIKVNWNRSGGTTGDSIRGELYILLIQLFANYCINPGRVLSTPRSQVNAVQIGLDHTRFKKILDALEEKKYILTRRGSNLERLTSRSMPTPKLIKRWLDDDWQPAKLKLKSKGGHLMSLKDEDKELYPANKWTKAHDLPGSTGRAVASSMGFLKQFNKELRSMRVRAPGSEFDMMSGELYRVFNNSNWSQGGRFYGHPVIQVSGVDRPKLLINDEPVVELDFQSLHVAIAYQNRGIELTAEELDNLYSGISHEGLIGDDKLPEPNVMLPNGKSALRLIKKKLTLIAFNASTDSKAIGGACKELRRDTYLKGLIPLDNNELKPLLKKLLSNIKIKHEPIAGQLATGKGIKFQYYDSQVMERVLRVLLLDIGIPVIPVHDSIIIQEKHTRLGRAVLETSHILEWDEDIPVTCEPATPRESYIEVGNSPLEADIKFRQLALSSMKKTLLGRSLPQETKELVRIKLDAIWDLDDWREEVKNLLH